MPCPGAEEEEVARHCDAAYTGTTNRHTIRIFCTVLIIMKFGSSY